MTKTIGKGGRGGEHDVMIIDSKSTTDRNEGNEGGVTYGGPTWLVDTPKLEHFPQWMMRFISWYQIACKAAK